MNFGALFHVIWPYALQLGGIAFAGWLAPHVKNAADSARAQAIAQVAHDTAAQVYANNPGLEWLALVKQVVDTMAAAGGVSTSREVLERAAAGALVKVGALPKK